MNPNPDWRLSVSSFLEAGANLIQITANAPTVLPKPIPGEGVAGITGRDL